MTIAPIDGFTSQTAEVGGINLHYRIGGDPAGSPVLLWHGFLGTSYIWRHVAPQLADAGCAGADSRYARIRRLRQAGGRRGL